MWEEKNSQQFSISLHIGLNFIRMAARVDAVAQRVQTALTMKQVQRSREKGRRTKEQKKMFSLCGAVLGQVTSSMQGVVKSMDAAMKSMNLVKISALMDKFEKQFEDLDVQTSYMEGAMSSKGSLAKPMRDRFVSLRMKGRAQMRHFMPRKPQPFCRLRSNSSTTNSATSSCYATFRTSPTKRLPTSWDSPGVQ